MKTTWGDFEVDHDSLLGRGGMGSVFKARQLSLDRVVAVKVLDTSRAPNEELEKAFFDKFQIEARALAKLRDARIISIIQAGQNDGKCWYAMELIDGETIDDRLTKAGMFDEKETARIGAETARALDAAWRQSITHRDVKPANIFLLKDGGVKLGDFGLARSVEFAPTRLTEMNAVAATPTYASPEQGLAGEGDHRSDMYSLGVVLYEMLTERPPFGGASSMETLFKHVNEEPPSMRTLRPSLSRPLEAIVMRCLEKEPADRYQSYPELVDDLDAVAAGRPVINVNVAEPDAKSSPLLWASSAVGAIVIAFLIATIWRTAAQARPVAAVAEKAKEGEREREPEAKTEPKTGPTKESETRPEKQPEKDPPKEPLKKPESLRSVLASYQPTAVELALLKEISSTLDVVELRKRSYERAKSSLEGLRDDPRHTDVTKRFHAAAVELVRLASTCVEARHRQLGKSAEATVILAGGPLTGRVTGHDAASIVITTGGKAVRVAFVDLAPGDYVKAAESERMAAAFQTVSSRPSIAKLWRLAESAEELLPWVFFAVRLAVQERGEFSVTKESFDLVVAQRKAALELFPYLKAEFDFAARESASFAVFLAGRFAEVLAGHEGTLTAPEAARRLYEQASPAFTSEELAAEYILNWHLEPEEKEPFLFLDSDGDALVLRDRSKEHSLVTVGAIEAATRGIALTFEASFERGGHVRISMESPRGGTQLRIGEKEMTLVLPKVGDEPVVLARGTVAVKGRQTLVVLPRPEVKRTFVYVDGALVLSSAFEDASIPKRFAITVANAEVRLFALKVNPEK